MNSYAQSTDRFFTCILVGLVLALAMLLCALPSANAQAADIVASGACGAESDNLTWTLDDEGLLTISGTGEMADYTSSSNVPWYSKRSNIKSVVIMNGVTSIGDYAFRNCNSLSNVTIPDSVTSIGRRAFEECDSLTSVTIPDSATSIGDYAFYRCLRLTSVTIPDSVTSIGDYAFYYCDSLTSVTIPDSVISIGDGVFSGCDSLTSVTIPDSVISIGSNAFSDCRSLISVTIPDSVTSIGEWAFKDCVSLISVTIPDSVTSIGSRTFSNCSSLTNVTIGNGVTSIGVQAFSDCLRLTSVTIPDSVTSIGESAFAGCRNLTSVTIPDSVISIGSNAFSDCRSLISVTIPDSVTSIEGYAFYNCVSLTGVIIGSGVTSIGEWAFKDCVSLISVTIPDSVTSIGSRTFSNCSSLTNVTIGNGVTSIGVQAFSSCNRLTSVTIPGSVTSIGDDAFSNCSSLTEIRVDSGNSKYSSHDGVLFNKEQTELICCPGGKTGTYAIPDSVTSIGKAAFYDCRTLTSVTIGNSVTSIGKSAFSGCDSLTSMTIPDSVTSIGSYAFSGCDSLTSVTIPDSVTSIGEWAFYSCDSLTSVTIGNGVIIIGNYAFYYCVSLTNVTIGNGVTSIGSAAFAYCDSLTDVYYGGTEAQWQAISIGSVNPRLINATIHYNSAGGDNKTVKVQFKGGIYNKENQLAEMDIKWSLDLFDQTSRNCNQDMMIASLVLSANAYDYILLEKTLRDMGFENCMPKNYDDESFLNMEDHVAFAIASKVYKGQNIIAIVCRGTGNAQELKQDILTNANGFGIAALEVKEWLNKYLTLYNIDTSKTTKVLITGHSRGGAVANYLGTAITSFADLEDTFVYTFASPNTTFFPGEYNHIHNITNVDDIVPGLPPLLSRFGIDYGLKTDNAPNFDINFLAITGVSRDVLTNPFSWLDCGSDSYAFPYRNHAPATYMAALLGDVNLYKGGYNIKLISVKCPVDVLVYDAYDRLLGKIENNVPDDDLFTNGIYAVVEGDEKYLYTAESTELRIELVGTDSGFMEYSVQVIDTETDEVTEEKTFETVELSEGKQMYSEVGGDIETPEVKLYILDEQGSATAEVLEDGTEVPLGPAYLPGDTNGDGLVNNKDVTRLMRYVKYGDVEVVTASLDVNGDGKINNKDVTRLMRYVKYQDVEIF